MVLEERITLMSRLGQYFLEGDAAWLETVEKAYAHNRWFTPEFIQLAVENITRQYLQTEKLQKWIAAFPSFRNNSNTAPEVGLVMAGNIPLVGFHDFLCVFLSGCRLKIKLSSKDTILWEFILGLLGKWNPAFSQAVSVAEQLKNCTAYIATGSNNSARYFEYYFRKYPHIIRSNRTSVAILSGQETETELAKLADDICCYFGLGCRNVTKIFVPEDYDFKPLLNALDRYGHHFDHTKYKHNYDFQLALYLLNKVEYMSSKSVLLVPSESAFAPISVLHYAYYENADELMGHLLKNQDLQCIVGNKNYFKQTYDMIDFGTTQQPGLNTYADNVPTLKFLNTLKER